MWNGIHECWLDACSDCRHSVQVRLDCRDAGAQACRVYLQVFHNALNVIARLSQWYALHPVNRINLGITRVPCRATYSRTRPRPAL
jgi:hypothetical protein